MTGFSYGQFEVLSLILKYVSYIRLLHLSSVRFFCERRKDWVMGVCLHDLHVVLYCITVKNVALSFSPVV